MAEMITLELRLVAQTPAAYGFTEDEPDDPVIWLPKSQVDVETRDPEINDIVKVEVPEWLAIDKGLA